MSVNTYTTGTRVRVSATIYDIDDVLTDPTNLKFKFIDPLGVETEYIYLTDPEIVNDGVGLFHVDLLISSSGTWRYRYETTGNVVIASESFLLGDTSRFA